MTKPLPIRAEALLQLLEDDEQVGVCTECGAIAQNVEPDAENYHCPECGAHAVQGLENILLLID